MNIIEDLGILPPTDTATYKTRFVIAECPYCKVHFKVQLRAINAGHTKSCGCLKKTNEKIITTKYLKEEYPRIYSIWKNMRNRGSNINSKQASNYVLKGITVCNEWGSFKVFLAWALNNGYQETLSIDRIDVTKGYFPENCRWVTNKVQSENTELLRKSNTSGYRGVSKKGDKFIARVTNNILNQRIYLGVFETAELAGKAYDNYLDENDLKYPRNFGASVKKG